MKQQEILTAKEFKELSKHSKKKKQEEDKVQLRVCEYLRKVYPNVIFACDLASGMKMPIWLAARNKRMRSSRGLPDLFIAHPSGQYAGLFLELKKAGVKLYKKDFSPASPHLAEQEEILKRLRDLKYAAKFAVGYDQAILFINEYMKG